MDGKALYLAVLIQGVHRQARQASGSGSRTVVEPGAVRCRALLDPRVEAGIRSGSETVQVGVMHHMRGHFSLACVSQAVLNGPFQLHASVLEPVSDLMERSINVSSYFARHQFEALIENIISFYST